MPIFTSFKVNSRTLEGKLDVSIFRRRLRKAQVELDRQVMNDMEPFMPYRTGRLVRETRAENRGREGTGRFTASGTDYGKYLYTGKRLVTKNAGDPWTRKGAKTYTTTQDIVFNKSVHPEAQAYWFEAAKKRHMKEWLRITKKTVGEG